MSSKLLTPDDSDSLNKTGKQRVTLRDIARRVGVSHVTVSRALRGAMTVKPGRRQEIQRIAKEMGYEPDPGLTALAAYRFRLRSTQAVRGTIGWLHAWADASVLRQHRMFEVSRRGAEQAAERLGYRVEEIRWTSEYSAQRVEQILLTRGIRGLLIPPQPPEHVWTEFHWAKYSVVRLSWATKEIPAPVVCADAYAGTQLAMGQIYDHGYRRIGLVFNQHFDDLLRSSLYGGYRVAQRRLGLRAALPPFDTGSPGPAGHSNETKRRLAVWLRRHRPDAILTCDQYLLTLLQELGCRVPQDIALAGTNVYDIPLDSGVAYSAEAIGAVAVETLVAQINGNRCGGEDPPSLIFVKNVWQEGKSLPVKRRRASGPPIVRVPDSVSLYSRRAEGGEPARR